MFKNEKILPEDTPRDKFKFNDLSHEDKHKLVSVFAWLMQEDKKQDPDLYKIHKTKNYD